ncbi:hypothetical protein HNP52_000305 [Sphingomonas kyeonggiensis]|uniref:Uncharacterized protein n=1 Tax=Sphingomonas kyeonggiensis TaxID=1268553 RepID=A0A7W7JXN1_9SPHN|nr:hypothetical protein [Sphingomonas kyeonggiensis]MBB4837254.1 hypothetical protein [Sphingomonas kyeonggiensis]
MPTNLVTDQNLLERLNAAARRGVSLQERRRQRVSFVYGNLPKGSAMTKMQVEKELERIDDTEGRR